MKASRWEMRDKKGLTGGKWVEREVEKNNSLILKLCNLRITFWHQKNLKELKRRGYRVPQKWFISFWPMIKCCSVGRWPLQTDLFFHLGTFLFKSQNIFQSGIFQLKNNLNIINIHFMVLDLASYLDKLLDHRQMLYLNMIKDANVCLFCVTHRADIWQGGTHLPPGR